MNYVGFEESAQQPVALTQAPSTPSWVTAAEPYAKLAPLATATFGLVTACCAIAAVCVSCRALATARKSLAASRRSVKTAQKSLTTAQQNLDNWQRQESHKADADLARRGLEVITDVREYFSQHRTIQFEPSVFDQVKRFQPYKAPEKLISLKQNLEYIIEEAAIVWQENPMYLREFSFLINDYIMWFIYISTIKEGHPIDTDNIEKGLGVIARYMNNKHSDAFTQRIDDSVKEVNTLLFQRLRQFATVKP